MSYFSLSFFYADVEEKGSLHRSDFLVHTDPSCRTQRLCGCQQYNEAQKSIKVIAEESIKGN